MTDNERIARLQDAYTRGRLQMVAPEALYGPLVGGVLLLAGADRLQAVLIAVLLAAAMVGSGMARTAMLRGARWGLLGVVGPTLSAAMMTSACPTVGGLTCTQMCLSLSVTVGVVLGAWGGIEAARSGRGAPLMGLLLTASIAGSGGCLATGVGHALGLALALGAALVPGYVVGRWTQSLLTSSS